MSAAHLLFAAVLSAPSPPAAPAPPAPPSSTDDVAGGREETVVTRDVDGHRVTVVARSPGAPARPAVLAYRDAEGRDVQVFSDRPVPREEAERLLADARVQGARAREAGARARAEGAHARAEGERAAAEAARLSDRDVAGLAGVRDEMRAAREELRAAQRELDRARADR